MPRNEPSLMPLLRSVASGREGVGAARFDDAQIRFVVALGLGPLLNYLVASDAEAIPRTHRAMVAGADLAGEAAHAKLRAALCEILDAGNGVSGTITLLKGMSICRHYPRSHLRTMGDIDLLTASDSLVELERVLLDLGYERGDFGMEPGFYDGHHHSCPFMHPQRKVRVEVHRRLFPPHCRIPDRSALGIDNVRAQRVVSSFEGREVFRLRNEMELAYAAAHWAYDMHLPLVWPGLLDTVFLLRSEGADVDWDLLGSWLGERETATPLFVLLDYLRRYGLIDLDAATFARLQRAPKSMGRLGKRTMHAIVDRCLDGCFVEHVDRSDVMEIVWRTLATPKRPAANLYAVPRNVVFPPHHPQRFSLRLQLRRLRSVFGNHRSA